jgi:tRNA-splicing ligase RtcB (3'-phosphate/5'-hydroxy nucleic acid ligase)
MNKIAVFGDHEPNTLAQLQDVASRAERAALMADGHLGYVMPIGGVAAYRNQISVVGVGFDIACGNAAIRTDLSLPRATSLTTHIDETADAIQEAISFGIGRRNRSDDAPVDHPLFESAAWDALPHHARNELRNKARAQLGTVGSGNHYIDIFVDESAAIWVGVHFGSRGLGHTIASGFLALSQGAKWGARVPEREVLLSLGQPMGQDYWELMMLAGEYAYAGREWVARKVVSLLGGRELDLVHNHHNFAWRERHGEHDVWVVRKGATPAFPGQRGFVGATMGEPAVIVEGVESGTSREALYSTVHGAGRVLSRTQAAGKSATVWECTERDCSHFEFKRDYISKRQAAGVEEHGRFTTCPDHPHGRMRKRFRRVVGGLVDYQAVRARLAAQGIVIRGGGADEAPEAYKRLDEVLAHHAGTVRVLHTLKPFAVLMAGEGEYDPYKD